MVKAVAQPAVKVSVVIPAYNATKTLRRTVESVMAQTLAEWEVIIINDSSTDKTSELAHKLAAEDKRVRVIDLARNVRQSAGRNLGFAEAKGDWLAILDADDAFTPERLEAMLEYAEARGLDMVADNQLFFDAGLGKVSRTAEVMPKPAQAWTLERHLFEEKLGKRFKWGLLKPVVRRAFLEAHGVAYRKEFHMGEDSLFSMELLALGAKAAVLARPMYVYTTARGEISGVQAGSTSRYTFADHVATYTYFEEKYGAGMTAGERAALRGCVRAAVASDNAESFKREVKRLKVGAALARLVRCPGLVRFVALGVWKLLRYRLAHKVLRKVKRG